MGNGNIIDISVADIKYLYDDGLVNRNTKCKFVRSHYGRYTYTFKVYGQIYRFSNGFESFDNAYHQELINPANLCQIIDMDTFIDDKDII